MKTCSNCEHREVCVVYTDKNEVCPKWQGWIKCEDELPSGIDDYLVVYKTSYEGNLHQAILRGANRKWYYDDFPFYEGKVLAWRPLPKYKEEQ